MTDSTLCQSKDLLASYLYAEATPDERRTFELHLATCADCRAEVEGLTGVRASLPAWEAPLPRMQVRLVADRPARLAGLRRWWLAAPLAAAAVLVLAAAAGLANLEFQYGNSGFIVRTGWESAPAPVIVPATAPPPPAAVPAPLAEAPWRADLLALEQLLREEVAATRAAVALRTASPGPVVAPAGMAEAEVLQRVQQLIDDSEVRQQRNLALRMAEISRDFAVQRQADLVQFQQGLGRLEGRTEAEAAKARELMNYIIRVSQPEAPK
jgi:hypothetical protein